MKIELRFTLNLLEKCTTAVSLEDSTLLIDEAEYFSGAAVIHYSELPI